MPAPSHTTEPADTEPPGDRGRQRGQVVIVVTLMLLVLMLMAAMAIDVGLWYNRSSLAQRAADSGALSAVTELVTEVKAGTPVATAQAGARARAAAIVAENGFEGPDVEVTVTFTQGPGGADHVRVRVHEGNLPLFFSGLFTDGVQVDREAEATMSHCQADCNQRLTLQAAKGGLIDTGTNGDGWEPVVSGDYVFNIYHHMRPADGKVMFCVDRRTNSACGAPGQYPVAPYPGMITNFTPQLAPDGAGKVWFVVQTTTSVGLGCWDGTTNSTCSGYGTPRNLASYVPNTPTSGTYCCYGSARIESPVLIGGRLFMYGDDNRMHCWSVAANAACAGYPRDTALRGVHDMALRNAASGFAGGVVTTQGIQFDQAAAPDGRIFTVLGPTAGDNRSWVGCWDTTTDLACTGWTDVSTTMNRNRLTFLYDATAAATGVCAHTGLGDPWTTTNPGVQCWDLAGTARATPVGLPLGTVLDGRPSVPVRTSAGHWVTYFAHKTNEAMCWDWNTGARCAIGPPNWDGLDDYAYAWDGDKCMIALGDQGKLWTFNVDDGQMPCRTGPSGGRGRFTPCPCANGSESRWTILSLTQGTDLDDFAQLLVTITLPDGSVWRTVDVVATQDPDIDLAMLNEMATVPAYVDVDVLVTVVDGRQDEVFEIEQNALALQSGVVPTLID